MTLNDERSSTPGGVTKRLWLVSPNLRVKSQIHILYPKWRKLGRWCSFSISTLWGTYISHRWKRKIIFKIDFSGDMLVLERAWCLGSTQNFRGCKIIGKPWENLSLASSCWKTNSNKMIAQQQWFSGFIKKFFSFPFYKDITSKSLYYHPPPARDSSQQQPNAWWVTQKLRPRVMFELPDSVTYCWWTLIDNSNFTHFFFETKQHASNNFSPYPQNVYWLLWQGLNFSWLQGTKRDWCWVCKWFLPLLVQETYCWWFRNPAFTGWYGK